MLVPRRVSKKKIWGARDHMAFRFFFWVVNIQKTGKGNPQQVDLSWFPMRCSYNRPLKYQSIKTVATNSMENLDPPKKCTKYKPNHQTIPTKPEKNIQPWTTRTPVLTPATSKTNSLLHRAKIAFKMLIFSGNLFQHAKISKMEKNTPCLHPGKLTWNLKMTFF